MDEKEHGPLSDYGTITPPDPPADVSTSTEQGRRRGSRTVRGAERQQRRARRQVLRVAVALLVVLVCYVLLNSPSNSYNQNEDASVSSAAGITGTVTNSSAGAPPPEGSLLPPLPDVYQHVWTSDAAKQSHQERLMVLFTLAVGATILVQLSKALIRCTGWLLAVLGVAVVVEALYILFKQKAWPHIHPKLPAAPQMPQVPNIRSKLPALPFGKKSAG